MSKGKPFNHFFVYGLIVAGIVFLAVEVVYLAHLSLFAAGAVGVSAGLVLFFIAVALGNIENEQAREVEEMSAKSDLMRQQIEAATEYLDCVIQIYVAFREHGKTCGHVFSRCDHRKAMHDRFCDLQKIVKLFDNAGLLRRHEEFARVIIDDMVKDARFHEHERVR